jgi:hypothetical protein
MAVLRKYFRGALGQMKKVWAVASRTRLLALKGAKQRSLPGSPTSMMCSNCRSVKRRPSNRHPAGEPAPGLVRRIWLRIPISDDL